MSNEINAADPTRLFICCFDFTTDVYVDADDNVLGDDGTFQIAVEAADVNDAAAKCRARLHEIAAKNEMLREVTVYAGAFIEVPRSDLTRGLLVNHQTFGNVVVHHYLPEQDYTGAKEHFLDEDEDVVEPLDDEGSGTDEGEPGEDDQEGEDGMRTTPVFWGRWRLYWCETEDHDEDWFVVARAAWEAEAFHVDEEGYDEDDATAELVCFLPDAEQLHADREGIGWPSHDLLLACGAEFLPYTPQDGFNELREHMASGSRVVRINGRIYSEGDIVSNVVYREGGEPDA